MPQVSCINQIIQHIIYNLNSAMQLQQIASTFKMLHTSLQIKCSPTCKENQKYRQTTTYQVRFVNFWTDSATGFLLLFSCRIFLLNTLLPILVLVDRQLTSLLAAGWRVNSLSSLCRGSSSRGRRYLGTILVLRSVHLGFRH